MGQNSKNKRDIYYRAARIAGFRSRSAFKLLQIDQHYNIFQCNNNDTLNIVDLCAAPGGWTEICQLRTTQQNIYSTIVAVDLQQMNSIEHVDIIHGDITKLSTANNIITTLNNNMCDIVLCDGAPDVINIHHIDSYMQHQLIYSALYITCYILNTGGTFIFKLFRTVYSDELLLYCQTLFADVVITKPTACRNASIECFVLCRGYKRTTENTNLFLHKNKYNNISDLIQQNKDTIKDIKFQSCRDGMKYIDTMNNNSRQLCSDTTYTMKYIISDTVSNKQILNKPIDPPYKHALALKRNQIAE